MADFPKFVYKFLADIFDREHMEADIIKTPAKARLGAMFLMIYDAKWKNSLEFWDALPLFVLIGKSADRWLGLNLHYLPYTWRVAVAKKLMTMFASKKRIQYRDVLKAIHSAKVPEGFLYMCIRTYLLTHIRSEVRMFDRQNYDIMIKNVMPKFKKKSAEDIYKILLSRFYKKIGGFKKKNQ